jgi:hypothetical protein
VTEAREALLTARDPRTLTRVELIQEVLRYRKYTGWLIVLNDDWADMDYDDEVSQVMIGGGVTSRPRIPPSSATPAARCSISYGKPRIEKTHHVRQQRPKVPILRRRDRAGAVPEQGGGDGADIRRHDQHRVVLVLSC